MANVPKKGLAAGILTPFTVHCAREVSTPTKVARDGRLFRVYFPHVNDGPRGLRLPQVAIARMPFMPGVERPRGLPKLVPSLIERDWGEPSFVANALRIDCYPEHAEGQAHEIAKDFYRAVRHVTGQWWVTRDNRFEAPLHRNSVDIDSRGAVRPSGFIRGTAMNIGLLGYERLLTTDLFAVACGAVESRVEWPLYWDLFLDAHYFHAVGDTTQCLFHSAMACESAIHHLIKAPPRGHPAKGEVFATRLDDSSLATNLRTHLLRSGSGHFENDCPNANAALLTTWLLRHGPAHGRPSRGRPPVDPSDGSEGASRAWVLRAALSFLRWLGVPDIPNAACIAGEAV